MKAPHEYAITVRLATDAELESVGATDHANTVDGAALVLIGADIVAVANEYGTVHLVADVGSFDDAPIQEQIEQLVEQATFLWTHEVVGR